MKKKISIKNKNVKLYPTKIICLGKNYLNHIKEMKSQKPDSPVIFLKPISSIIYNKDKIIIPRDATNPHYEVELVAVIGKKGKNISSDKTDEYISGYGIGLDITLRDFQSEAKKNGNPWGICKGFDTSAPVSDFISSEKIIDPHNLDIKLYKNKKLVQHDNTKNMIFKMDEIIEYISKFFTLYPGDLIFTGTPSGVGPIENKDTLRAQLGDLITLENNVRIL
ncbi:MAG: fumarylacetoacetate hydrolase family protein [Candidatus Mcinerneyibacterium aminivorans]|uniref:Fumarylacetoacetate hydrolase family protein n=1 Tax=Candidatus Mcinerneyibacterium aminivorans TaxID=2703815 RepID=A0A5D0MI54_9BACT|nr:MAG: fumarylacetoacetate hydrolase family protein [Candidatus Mcinerneyibacterium aminivorans]